MHNRGVGISRARISGVGVLAFGIAGCLGGMIAVFPALAHASVSMDTQYEIYAAGLHIADVRTDYDLGPRSYEMRMGYHTTGLVNMFTHGTNKSSVSGTWHGEMAHPQHLLVAGSFKGAPRQTDIDFSTGVPVVRRLVPADTRERAPIPDALKDGSIDILSAMADVMRAAGDTGHCDLAVRTYDGHRVLSLVSRTVGQETLGPYRNAQFAGSALRCDFTATPVAGMKENDTADARPFRGSIWLAPLTPGNPPVPVRMAFETRWFGDAMMCLTKAAPNPSVVVAGAH